MATTEPRAHAQAPAPQAAGQTHEVTNQPPPLVDYDTFTADRPLVEALLREGGEWAHAAVSAAGARAGSAEQQTWGREANENPPRLRTHDRFGHRIDEVEYHPSYHALQKVAVEQALHALPWRERREGAHVARAALFMTGGRAEAGVGCPTSMTYSVIPALRTQPELAAEWEPLLTSTIYDPGLRHRSEKRGALAGMAMTEKQGGSDVRANTTMAAPVNGGGPAAEYALTGHKWFCSAPMCDVFLVLAQAPGGLSCFLVPRILDDGSRNRFHLQRLKDKLGNRSNASSEVEFRSAIGRLVGEEGRGVPTIIEMVNHTRLDCVLGATAGMRAGVEQAIHHATYREAFGKRLIDQPLMVNVLADLAVESEAATVAAMRLARSYDGAQVGDERETLFRRLATPVLKYWTCKRAPWHAVESLECLGGNGYVEESGMPRLFRESPLNSIWEGSGNVQCLDTLRAMVKSPEALSVLLDEIGQSAGADPRLDQAIASIQNELSDLEQMETRARRVVERLALVLQASLLVRHGDPAVADAFCASRLGGDWGHAFGTLPAGIDQRAIVDRHAPQLA
ncbi:MAG: acyl-CoA dehydrogenase family protein [Solirubrobacterales bacterium]